VTPRTRLVGQGAGWALAIALPAALLAQVVTAASGSQRTSPVVYPCVVIALVGMAVGGWAAGRTRPDGAAALGALSGLAAIGVVQLLGVVREAAAGDHVAWATIPAVLVLGAGLGALGAVTAPHLPGRTRP
jgi:hypothetical protein